MGLAQILETNLLSPVVLAFVLGLFTKLIGSEFSLPRDLYASLSIYLLLAIGLKGGVELAQSELDQIAWPILVTLLIGCLTPITAYFLLRKLGKFSTADSAGIAAHYGSVSAVTFIAASQFTTSMGQPAEGFMPTLLTLLESPGIHIALAIGVLRRPESQGSTAAVAHEILTSRSMILLLGGLLIGALIGVEGFAPIKPFFETGFKGALVLFLLEMGILAGGRFSDLKRVGPFLIAFGILFPLSHGILAVVLGHWAGLSIGGCTVLGAMAASASYIAAPPAVRLTLPEANPTYYLTASLAITFPFNIVAGIPVFFQVASWLK